MGTGHIGVAISTTGDEHRLLLLATCVAAWREYNLGGTMVVTVDGDEEACARVENVVRNHSGSMIGGTVHRVGQPWPDGTRMRQMRDGRMGVAVSKNTGIELLMERGVDHLFLSDDDTWPLNYDALRLHVSGNLDHSMVCWGQHRFIEIMQDSQCAAWNWPRGAMIYTRRDVIERVGGMVEAFGPGGHEHVEWSRRIHQHGLTPTEYPSPYAYATERAMAARNYWHAEDMPLPGEGIAAYKSRKQRTTSVRRLPTDWTMIDQIMARQDGRLTFVPYTAGKNGRASATLYHSRGA